MGYTRRNLAIRDRHFHADAFEARYFISDSNILGGCIIERRGEFYDSNASCREKRAASEVVVFCKCLNYRRFAFYELFFPYIYIHKFQANLEACSCIGSSKKSALVCLSFITTQTSR